MVRFHSRTTFIATSRSVGGIKLGERLLFGESPKSACSDCNDICCHGCKPLTLKKALVVYDRFLTDDRVEFHLCTDAGGDGVPETPAQRRLADFSILNRRQLPRCRYSNRSGLSERTSPSFTNQPTSAIGSVVDLPRKSHPFIAGAFSCSANSLGVR